MPVVGGKAYRQNWQVKEYIRKRDNDTCRICGCKVGDVCNKHASVVNQMDVAHIVAWDHSPESSSLANLQLQCHPCNAGMRTVPSHAPSKEEWVAQMQAYVHAR